MNRILFLSLLLSLAAIDTAAQEESNELFSMLFIGDIMGHDDQIISALDTGTGKYSYDTVFSYVAPLIGDADLAFANFEVTLAGRPYKGYPQFSSPPELAVACREAGIDCFLTANNHSADRGYDGVMGTIMRLDSLGISHTGTFRNEEERDTLNPLIICSKGISVAVLNYTYGTNGIEVPGPVTINMLDTGIIGRDLEKTAGLDPDITVLFLHWGTEYNTIPSSQQEKIARQFLSMGADLVIGSHPHVLQKMIWTKEDSTEGLIVYSLGNFISNQRRPGTDGGTMVRILFERDNGSLRIKDAGYCLTWVYIPVNNGKKEYYILPCAEFEDKTDFFTDQADFLQMKKFTEESRNLLNRQNIAIPEITFRSGDWLPVHFDLDNKGEL